VSFSCTKIGETVCEVLGIKEDQPLEIIPIVRGGSARSFYRVRCGSSTSYILMQYDRDRRENNYYASQAGFLRGIGVSVPRIFHHDAAGGIILMEDLGECDLWHYRQATGDIRRRYYFQTLDMIRKLHALRLGDASLVGLPLMEAFGPELYRWEREYFRQHFVRGVCRIELSAAESESLEAELVLLAAGLAGMPACLIHRDLQSQNVMICGNEPVLIDFQGMRYGHPCYDLGSLLYDPYVTFTAAEREELFQYYYCFYQKEYDLAHFRAMFQQASVQRLMQALGAYGFLGRQQNKSEFLAHIPSALANLIEAASDNPRLCLLRNLARRCREALTDKEVKSDP
jgi:aminoglycoside/choline kinase family phosphotransferase